MYNTQFEFRLINAMIYDKDFARRNLSLLETSYFSTPELKLVFEIVRDLWLDTSISKITFDIIEAEAESRGVNDLEVIRRTLKMVESSPVEDVSWLEDKVETFVRSQRLKRALFNAINIIEEGKPLHNILAEIDRALSISKENYIDGEFLEKEFFKTYRRRYDKESIIPTGYKAIDDSMFGGMLPEELHVIMAPPKTGKSTFACNIGYRVARLAKKPVIHISLELSELDVGAIYIQMIGKLTHFDLLTMSDKEFEERVVPVIKYIKNNIYIKKFPAGTTTTMHIRSFISQLRAEGKIGNEIGLIVIDYDDLLLPTVGKISLYEDSGNIYKDILSLAGVYNTPVLTLTQPNREAVQRFLSANNNGKSALLEWVDISHSTQKCFYLTSLFSLNPIPGSDNYVLHNCLIRRGSKARDMVLKGQLDTRTFVEVEEG